jgi:hypothetical protein
VSVQHRAPVALPQVRPDYDAWWTPKLVRKLWGREKSLTPVGFEVFTAVVLKSIFFWDMTPCPIPRPSRQQSVALPTKEVRVNLYFVRPYKELSGKMTGEITNVKFITSNFLSVCFLLSSTPTGVQEYGHVPYVPMLSRRQYLIGYTYGLHISIKRYTSILCYYTAENTRVDLRSGATVYDFSRFASSNNEY